MTAGILCIYQAFGYTLECERVGTVPVPRAVPRNSWVPFSSPAHAFPVTYWWWLFLTDVGSEKWSIQFTCLGLGELPASFLLPIPQFTHCSLFCVAAFSLPLAFKVLSGPKMKSNRRSRKYPTLGNNLDKRTKMDKKTSMAVLPVVLPIARNLCVHVVSETSFKLKPFMSCQPRACTVPLIPLMLWLPQLPAARSSMSKWCFFWTRAQQTKQCPHR